jgi:hypothetical protein
MHISDRRDPLRVEVESNQSAAPSLYMGPARSHACSGPMPIMETRVLLSQADLGMWPLSITAGAPPKKAASQQNLWVWFGSRHSVRAQMFLLPKKMG